MMSIVVGLVDTSGGDLGGGSWYCCRHRCLIPVTVMGFLLLVLLLMFEMFLIMVMIALVDVMRGAIMPGWMVVLVARR